MNDDLLDSDRDIINKGCKEYCEQYSNLLNSDNNFKELFDKMIKISHNFETFRAHLESIQADTDLIANKTIPSIHSQLLQLKPIFEFIDQLEKTVAQKKEFLSDLENKLMLEESTSKNGIQNDLNIFMFCFR
ncbi:unnamed protein product [Gordionus sp. m RMFG-2023]